MINFFASSNIKSLYNSTHPANMDSDIGQYVVDYLPYIDDEITELEKEIAESLVQEEFSKLDKNILNSTHKRVSQICTYQDKTSKYNSSLLLQASEDDKFKSEIENGEGIGGIDLTMYSKVFNDDGTLNEELYNITLNCTLMRQRSLEILQKYGKNQYLIFNDNLDNSNKLLEIEIDKKRKQIDEINQERKRICTDFKPMNDYLKDKWKDSLNNLITTSVECARIQLENELSE